MSPSLTEKPPTVLFLCAGNTCRSPLAEILARQRYGRHGLRFLSAGLQALSGQAASPGSREVAAELGLSLVRHSSQAVSQELLHEVDWVIGMTRTQVAIFKLRYPHYRGRIGLLGAPGLDLAERAETPEGEEVADPIGGTFEQYRAMGAQLDRLLEAWGKTFVPIAEDREEET